MKRNSFISACVAAGTFISSPFALVASAIKTLREDKGFKVDAGKDRFEKEISLLEGDTFYTKVSTKDTEGDIYVFESKRIKEGGPPHHFHFDQDEWWYVLQGEFLIKVGDVVHKAKAGDSVFGPRKVPHSFAKIGEGEARLLMFFQPAGKMEEFFTKVSQGATKGLTGEQGAQFRIDHGFKIVGPPINQLKKG